MTIDIVVKIVDLVVEGSVVVVVVDDDVSYDYYFLKVKSNGVEELVYNIIDDYGSIYIVG